MAKFLPKRFVLKTGKSINKKYFYQIVILRLKYEYQRCSG